MLKMRLAVAMTPHYSRIDCLSADVQQLGYTRMSTKALGEPVE